VHDRSCTLSLSLNPLSLFYMPFSTMLMKITFLAFFGLSFLVSAASIQHARNHHELASRMSAARGTDVRSLRRRSGRCKISPSLASSISSIVATSTSSSTLPTSTTSSTASEYTPTPTSITSDQAPTTTTTTSKMTTSYTSSYTSSAAAATTTSSTSSSSFTPNGIKAGIAGGDR
jgi:hypothetical protein